MGGKIGLGCLLAYWLCDFLENWLTLKHPASLSQVQFNWRVILYQSRLLLRICRLHLRFLTKPHTLTHDLTGANCPPKHAVSTETRFIIPLHIHVNTIHHQSYFLLETAYKCKAVCQFSWAACGHLIAWLIKPTGNIPSSKEYVGGKWLSIRRRCCSCRRTISRLVNHKPCLGMYLYWRGTSSVCSSHDYLGPGLWTGGWNGYTGWGCFRSKPIFYFW